MTIYFRYLSFLFYCLISGTSLGQTLVINEVSNGPSGAKEWVELIVVSSNPMPCSPEFMDLRGWIIDDNNGYFKAGSGTGIATGCCRFSMSNFWSAIPVGTVITIFSEEDEHPFFTPSTLDQSITDGNCKLTMRIDNNLFERNELQPSTSDASYPTIGWLSGGSWSTLALSNDDDSFQIRNPANLSVPVFSVSYGNNDQNNHIYFAGGGGQTTFFANQSSSCTWNDQTNWSFLNVIGNETPTQENSVANGSCIGNQAQNCLSTGPNFEITVSNDTLICQGTSALIQADGADSYSWDNGLPNVDQHVVAPNSSTWYHVTGTTNGCSDDDSIFVEVEAPHIIELMDDIVICQNQLVMLENVSSSGQGEWSVTSTEGKITFQNTSSINQTLLFDIVGTYQLVYSDTSAVCGPTADYLNVTYSNCQELEMPNVFSPDGDGINDFYFPKLDGDLAIIAFECTIFNRWGGENFVFTQGDKGWDGSLSNGKEAADGTYFYRLEGQKSNGEVVKKQGFFQLIRKGE